MDVLIITLSAIHPGVDSGFAYPDRRIDGSCQEGEKCAAEQSQGQDREIDERRRAVEQSRRTRRIRARRTLKIDRKTEPGRLLAWIYKP